MKKTQNVEIGADLWRLRSLKVIENVTIQQST